MSGIKMNAQGPVGLSNPSTPAPAAPPVQTKDTPAPSSAPVSPAEKTAPKGHSLHDSFAENNIGSEPKKAEGIKRSLDKKSANPYAPKKSVDEFGNLTVEYRKDKEHNLEVKEQDGKLHINNKKNPYQLKSDHTEEIDPSKYNSITVKTGDKQDSIDVGSSLSKETAEKFHVEGGDGKNSYTGAAPQNNYTGGKDVDSVHIKRGGSQIFTEGGDDRVHAYARDGKHYIYTGDGNDYVTARGVRNEVKTGAGDDTVYVGHSESRNIVQTGSGDDMIESVASERTSNIDGGNGVDAIEADSNDIIFDEDGDEKTATRKDTPTEAKAKSRIPKEEPTDDSWLPNLPDLPDLPDIEIPEPVKEKAEEIAKDVGEWVYEKVKERAKDKAEEVLDEVLDDIFGSKPKKK